MGDEASGWRFEKEVYEGVRCWSKPETGTSLRKFLASGIVPIEPQQLAKLLWNTKDRLSWDISYDGIDEIVTNYSNQLTNDHAMLVRLKIKSVLIVSARDFCNVQLKRQLDSTGTTMCSVSFSITDTRCPVHNDYVRGEVLPGSAWYIEPVPVASSSSSSLSLIHSRLTYVIFTDIKGWVPVFAINNAVAQTFTNYYTELDKWAKSHTQ